MFTGLNYTFKLLREVPISRNSPEQVERIFAYAVYYNNNAPNDALELIWVDETGFNLHIRRKFGRAQKGHRASIQVPTQRGKNISIAAAMSYNGLLTISINFCALDVHKFGQFVESLCELLRKSERTYCWIILDNARFHHCANVAQIVEQNGHQLIFLPPYSPMLNPIESLFGKWKTLVRSNRVSYSRDVLLQNLNQAVEEIIPADCQGWI
jgi:transposase